MSCSVDFTAKVLLKSTIEKETVAGIIRAYVDLVASLVQHVLASSPKSQTQSPTHAALSSHRSDVTAVESVEPIDARLCNPPLLPSKGFVKRPLLHGTSDPLRKSHDRTKCLIQ